MTEVVEQPVEPVPAVQQPNRPRPWYTSRWLLAAILLLAFMLRAWNLDWDRGTNLQPDERFWSDVAANVHTPDSWELDVVLDPTRSPLNPRVYKDTYVYGTLPLWASEAAAAVLMNPQMQWFVGAADSLGIDLLLDRPDLPYEERLRFNTGYEVTIIGRLMSALVDTATVFMVYLLGRELVDRRTGMLAAFLQALTVLHIQYSHFLGSEPWVAFFVTCTVFGSVRLARNRGGWRTRIFTALAFGFAVASKLNGVAALAAPAVAALIVAEPQLRALFVRRIRPGALGSAARKIEPFLVMALVSVVAYRIAQPYDFRAGISLVYNDEFRSDFEYLSDINSGGNVPWVQPLVGRTPLIHPLKQMLIWGMGPGLGLASVFGVIVAAYRVRRGERYWAVPLAVIGSYLLLVSLQFYAIIRYLQPAYPIATALAAAGLIAAWRWARQVAPARPRLARLATIAAGLCVASTAFWAFAFVNGVYDNDNARLAASDWMVEHNLPAGSTISVQEWDDGLPWARFSELVPVTLRPFSFEGDTPEKIEALIDGLDQVDYVVESSNKFYDSLPRTPARFPQITTYYERLFDGSLGFELVKTFKNDPTLFGITIDDSGAEEAFTLYDHPTVHIWQKTEAFSVERAYELLNPDRARTTINALPRDAFANGGMLTPVDYQTQQSGSSFSDVHHNDPPSLVAALLWFGVLQLVALSVAPFVVRFAGRAAGVVYGLSKPLALAVFALPLWLMVSWGWFEFSRSLVVAAMITICALGALFIRRNVDALRGIWREHRRVILWTEAVFVAVFLFVLVLRLGNPDTWHPWRGGEKPMELAYFTAVTGSTTMPPYDPWLAGGSLNYYYMGWFLLAVPTRLLGFLPAVAFNLGVATYAAIAAVTVFSTTALLAHLARRRSVPTMPVVGTGLLATLMFLVIGNLDSVRQVWRRLTNGEPLSQFDWWDPTRVLKASPGTEVTEFPAFTVLFADLHPHFMAMGFFGLGLAGCIAFVERTRTGAKASSWLLAVGLGLGSGLMRMVHTWDLPTYVLFVGGAVMLGWIKASGPVAWRIRTAVAQLATIAVVHLLVTAPYRAHNQVGDSGFHRSVSSSNLDDWLVHWGLFLFIGAGYGLTKLVSLRRTAAADAPIRAPIVLATIVVIAAVGFVVLHGRVGSVAAWAFLGLVIAASLLVAELRNRDATTADVIVASAWVLGIGVLLGVEIYTQNADINRLNTVFKFWLQSWHLFAVAGAFSAMWILSTAPSQPISQIAQVAQASRASTSVTRLGLPRRGFATALVALLVLSLLYPALSLRPRQANRINTTLGPSLDGQLWLQPGQLTIGVRDFFGQDFAVDPGRDRAIIDWLQTNAEGRPTIVEAVGGAEYQWWGRIAINTGLPTVLGWRWHQSQQRTVFDYAVNRRNEEIARFYTAVDQAEIDAFLRAYDVTYVIVGTLENGTANPVTLELFRENPSLREAFRQSDLVIYEVAKSSLAQFQESHLANRCRIDLLLEVGEVAAHQEPLVDRTAPVAARGGFGVEFADRPTHGTGVIDPIVGPGIRSVAEVFKALANAAGSFGLFDLGNAAEIQIRGLIPQRAITSPGNPAAHARLVVGRHPPRPHGE